MNIKRFVILSTILCLLVSSTVAAKTNFSTYHIKKSGYRYSGIEHSGNKKTENWNKWYVYTDHVRFKRSNGIGEALCFTPMRLDRTYYIAGGSYEWVYNSGDFKSGGWNRRGYTDTEYHLGVRLDTDYCGSEAEVTGTWNADYR